MTVNRSVQKQKEQQDITQQTKPVMQNDFKPNGKTEPIAAVPVVANNVTAKTPDEENSSPRHHRQNQAPSFIPLDETTSSPKKSPISPRKTLKSPQKQQKELLSNKSSDQTADTDSEGRASRGPTFYQVKQKQNQTPGTPELNSSNSSSKKGSPIIGDAKKQKRRSDLISNENYVMEVTPVNGEHDDSETELEESTIDSKETDNLMLHCNDVVKTTNKPSVLADFTENKVNPIKCLNQQQKHQSKPQKQELQPQEQQLKHEQEQQQTLEQLQLQTKQQLKEKQKEEHNQHAHQPRNRKKHKQLISQESTDTDSPIRIKNNQSMDSLEWDHTYSYSESGSSSSSPIADQQPHCPIIASPPQSTTPQPVRSTSKTSSTGSTRTAPISSIEWDPSEEDVRTGSAECEWEPYVVEEPNSGRSSGRDEPVVSGRGSTCPQKGQMVKKQRSYEATVSPQPIK